MSAAIRVQGLGKQYRIGMVQENARYATLRDAVSRRMKGLFGGRNGAGEESESRVWALRDLDLTVSEGEIVGVIGRNGSGKSTMLKILSDIVEPTEGRAEIRGRIAALLEVGTGFHGELTGRENVYLNGAILGMHQHEIRRNFDSIVEFSGIGAFIDTPVKRYSSGMYVRLAFAVAAHLEPQVLVVDEVLAVGDFEFQQRCIGRMREVGQGGRTVLFVSHNMAAVEALCTRCVLIEGGRLIMDGEPYEVARAYRQRLSKVQGAAVVSLDQIEGAKRKRRILRSAQLVDEHGQPSSIIGCSRAFEIRIGVTPGTDVSDLVFAVRVENLYGERMTTFRSPVKEADRIAFRDHDEIVCRVREFPLAPGVYRIGLAVFGRNDQLIDETSDVLSITVTDSDMFGEGRSAVAGVCIARSEWSADPPAASAALPADPAARLDPEVAAAPGGAR